MKAKGCIIAFGLFCAILFLVRLVSASPQWGDCDGEQTIDGKTCIKPGGGCGGPLLVCFSGGLLCVSETGGCLCGPEGCDGCRYYKWIDWGPIWACSPATSQPSAECRQCEFYYCSEVDIFGSRNMYGTCEDMWCTRVHGIENGCK
jgi:hypothetical protein